MSSSPPPTLKAQLEQARRDAYRSCALSAARGLFEAQGYRGITMADIARSVGVSKGTLYNYFDSKEALFAEMVKHARGELLSTLDGAVQAYNGWARLEALVHFMLGFAYRNARMLAVYHDAIGGERNPAADPAKQQGERAIISRYLTCLESIAAQGELRADVPPEIMAKTLAWTVKAWSLELPRDCPEEEVEAVAAHLTRLFRAGIAKPPDAA